MRLSISDGYTISGNTSGKDAEGTDLPAVNFSYRPALPDAIYEWRYQTRMAQTGTAELDAAVKLITSHVTKWDVTWRPSPGTPEEVAPITPATVRRLPNPIVQEMISIVCKWLPPSYAESVGNS